jgi:hypothetical protein
VSIIKSVVCMMVANKRCRGFYWRVAAIGAMSLIPTYAAKVIQRTMKPPSYRKVQGI